MPEQPPDPNAVFAAQKAEADTARMGMELQSKQIDLAMKQVELRAKEIELAMRFGVPPAQAGFGPASA